MTTPGGPWLSIVIPALDERAQIADVVAHALALADEVIVVDGGSGDGTPQIASRAGARVIQGPRGRAHQMNAGAAAARGRWLLFLHADCRLPERARTAIASAAERGARWGRFDVALDAPGALLAVVGAAMNWRSRLSGICTGDQAIFVSRELWRASGGFAAIPLMEDIELSARLRAVAPPANLRDRVRVSARRWQRDGAIRTIVSMWWYRALYFFGASPAWLHRQYYGRRCGGG